MYNSIYFDRKCVTLKIQKGYQIIQAEYKLNKEDHWFKTIAVICVVMVQSQLLCFNVLTLYSVCGCGLSKDTLVSAFVNDWSQGCYWKRVYGINSGCHEQEGTSEIVGRWYIVDVDDFHFSYKAVAAIVLGEICKQHSILCCFKMKEN